MPFRIVRNDIVNMKVDAIVNTANPKPIVGYGCDAGIHAKAGPELLAARQKIGCIDVGHAALTPGFDLDAGYVIHAVGPVWIDGTHGEENLLRRCYESALALALEHKCESVAFPLLSAGNHGVPKPIALQTALNVFNSFLMEHEMDIYLVVFSKSSFELSEKLFSSVDSYIDENYILSATLHEYGMADKCGVRGAQIQQIQEEIESRRKLFRKSFFSRQKEARLEEKHEFRRSDLHEEMYEECSFFSLDSAHAPCPAPRPAAAPPPPCAAPAPAAGTLDLDALLKATDAGFSETLLKLIDRAGKKDSDIYKKANVDRKLFSKIRSNPDYKPSKSTALAFALALELDLEETQDFIRRAGYTLSHSSRFDVIVEYFIMQKNYNIIELDATLFHYDLPLIGS